MTFRTTAVIGWCHQENVRESEGVQRISSLGRCDKQHAPWTKNPPMQTSRGAPSSWLALDRQRRRRLQELRSRARRSRGSPDSRRTIRRPTIPAAQTSTPTVTPAGNAAIARDSVVANIAAVAPIAKTTPITSHECSITFMETSKPNRGVGTLTETQGDARSSVNLSQSKGKA